MIEKIENDFKKKINYKMKSTILTLIFLLLIIICIISIFLVGSWLAITISLAFILFSLLYIYFYTIIKTKGKSKLKNMFDEYKRIKRDDNLKKLLDILRNNGVNSKLEIELLIKYYQNKQPKNVNSSGQLLSTLALFSSFFFFVVDPDFSTINEKIIMSVKFLIVCALIYYIFNTILKELKDIHSADNFSIMMEKYLIEIIVKKIIT